MPANFPRCGQTASRVRIRSLHPPQRVIKSGRIGGLALAMANSRSGVDRIRHVHPVLSRCQAPSPGPAGGRSDTRAPTESPDYFARWAVALPVVAVAAARTLAALRRWAWLGRFKSAAAAGRLRCGGAAGKRQGLFELVATKQPKLKRAPDITNSRSAKRWRSA